MRRLFHVALVLADIAVPPRRLVVVHSKPDLDDNVVALLRSAPDEVEVIVLAQDPMRADGRASALGLHVASVRRRSVRGLWLYLRASVTVCSHGMFGSRRRHRGRRVVGLWHGEFGKPIGALIGEPRRHYDWVPVSSELARLVRSAEFTLHPDRIHVVGLPRHRLLSQEGPRLTEQRVVVWAPTYRAAADLQRVDGDPDVLEQELPLDDEVLQALLEKHDAELWCRMHPSDSRQEFPRSPRIRLATDEALQVEGITFYELLARASLVVTDYSSLWVDALLVELPILGFCPDLEVFLATRGVTLAPHSAWFPGQVVTSRTELLGALDAHLSGQDTWIEKRSFMRSLLHGAPDDRPDRAVWSEVLRMLEVRS